MKKTTSTITIYYVNIMYFDCTINVYEICNNEHYITLYIIMYVRN